MVEFPAVPLWRYAQRIGYRECAFFGITHPDNVNYACREVWTQYERDNVFQALLLAQEQIERVSSYNLVPKWTTGEYHHIKTHRGSHVNLYQTERGYLIAPGVMSDVMIEDDATVNYASDPAVITIANVTCAEGDIRVFHPDSDDEISPSSVSVVAGTLTIQIPFCRLLDKAYWYEGDPIQYADYATWGVKKVDVRCISNDTTTQAIFHGKENCADCDPSEASACIYIKNPKLGLVEVNPETCVCGSFDHVELNYYSGKTPLSRVAEDAIIRLAHASMPTEPCGCAITQRLWERDREMPKYFLSRERINCPFGMTEGAWAAWIYANGQELVRGTLWA